MCYAQMTPEQLFKENQGLIYKILQKHYPNCLYGAERDDYWQIARQGLWRAAQTYDPGRGKFSTHAFWKIRGAMVCELRHYGYGKLSTGKYHTAGLIQRQESSYDPEVVFDIGGALQVALDTLPRQEASVALLRAEGFTQLEIGDKMGLTRQRIQQIEKSAYDKLRRMPELERML